MKNTLPRITVFLFFFLSFTISVFAHPAHLEEGSLLGPIQKGDLTINLETVATGLTAPNWGTFASGVINRLFVSDQPGTLWSIDLTTGEKSVFLDISDRLVNLGIAGPGTFDERGLLGVAFHPGYAENGRLYTYTSEPVDGPADFSTIVSGSEANHQSVITEWQVPEPLNPESVVNLASSRVLLRIDQPQFNHNGGTLEFGPDSLLYISLGDGGNADDQGDGHGTDGNGQNPANVLGAILRIDPGGSNSSNGQYGIPDDNPFIGQIGFVDEIYAYGFRNPFRFSFDYETGDLYVGDVGQNDIEEVDIVLPGNNYGWNLKEGSFCFDPNGDGPGFAFEAEPCLGEPPGLIDPIAEYNTADDLENNDDGRAVVGGFVYRGSRIPPLVGKYIFGDYSQFTSSGINNDGRLFYLDVNRSIDRAMIESRKIQEFYQVGQERLGLSVLGFGQDASGELYILGNETGTPFGETGIVLRIAPVSVDLSPDKDNTLYEHEAGSLSNGAGEHFFAGKTLNGSIRRGVITFDLSRDIHPGSIITNVSLQLNMSKTSSGAQTVSLHKLLANWGEGTSDASLNEGGGAPATPGDATWLHTYYDSDRWIANGGDFSPSPTVTTTVVGIGFYTWGSTPQMVADVQAWLDNTESNFGWLLMGEESENHTTKRFDSKENHISEKRPMLSIEFLPPPSLEKKVFLPLIVR